MVHMAGRASRPMTARPVLQVYNFSAIAEGEQVLFTATGFSKTPLRQFADQVSTRYPLKAEEAGLN